AQIAPLDGHRRLRPLSGFDTSDGDGGAVGFCRSADNGQRGRRARWQKRCWRNLAEKPSTHRHSRRQWATASPAQVKTLRQSGSIRKSTRPLGPAPLARTAQLLSIRATAAETSRGRAPAKESRPPPIATNGAISSPLGPVDGGPSSGQRDQEGER